MSEDQNLSEVEARPQDQEAIEVEPSQEIDEGAEKKPDNQRVPLAKFVQTKKEKQEAQRQLEESQREVQALKQQQELYKLSAAPIAPEGVTRPKADDYYDDPDGYEAAMDKYDSNLVKRATEESQKMLDNKFQSIEQQDNLKQAQQRQQESIDSYYGRAEALNADDFLEVEEKVRGEIDDELYTVVIGYFDNAEHVIYSLGGDLEKAADMQKSIKADPIRGFQKLIRYADSLDKKLETKQIPEPDEAIKGGLSGVANAAAKVEKLRDQCRAGKITMNEFMTKKRELEA